MPFAFQKEFVPFKMKKRNSGFGKIFSRGSSKKASDQKSSASSDYDAAAENGAASPPLSPRCGAAPFDLGVCAGLNIGS